VTPALFLAEGQAFVPTDASRGPWSPKALHGGPVAALVARAVEAACPEGMEVARLTLELMRPVPLRPLSVSAALVRPGRKVGLVEAGLAAGGQQVAAARALLVRRQRLPVPGPPPAPGPPGPEQAPRAPVPAPGSWTGFHNYGAELAFVDGAFGAPGPATAWIRLRAQVVAGEAPSPLQRAAAAADFANGVGSSLPFESFSFINPDLTVHLERYPEGEWVGLEASMRCGPVGRGLARGELWDRHGPLGCAHQAVLVEPR